MFMPFVSMLPIILCILSSPQSNQYYNRERSTAAEKVAFLYVVNSWEKRDVILPQWVSPAAVG